MNDVYKIQKNVIELMDELGEAELALESMHHVSVLLMDTCRESRDDVSGRLIYCFYMYSILLERIVKSCMDRLDMHLLELKKQIKSEELADETSGEHCAGS